MASEATILSIELWLRVGGEFIGLSVAGFKLFHEGNEGVDTGFGEGVVYGGAEAADGAVAFEGFEIFLGGFLEEDGFEVGVGDAPGDVHVGAAFGDGGSGVEVGGVYCFI